MKPPPEPGPIFKSGLLPMVDVAFLLLIAFLGSVNFVGLDEKVAVMLPKNPGLCIYWCVRPPPPPCLDVTLRPWDRGGRTEVYLADMHLGTGRQGFRNLERLIRVVVAGSTEYTGEIDAAADIPHRDVVSALDALTSAGVNDIDFIGAPAWSTSRR